MPEHIEKLEALLTARAPFMRTVVTRARERFGDAWRAEFEALLAADLDGAGLDAAVSGYIKFALESLRLQKQFEKSGRYPLDSFDAAAEAVYHNGDYMRECYLPGLLLSQYLWPHHYLAGMFFRERFLPQLAADVRFAEIGIGTGCYTTDLLAAHPASSGTAFDLSTHSLAFAAERIAKRGMSGRWQGVLRDVIAMPPEGRWPAVICVEVLEHLTEPEALLKANADMLDGGGVAFVTAALTAAHADHIYLYRDADEVLKQAQSAGLAVREWREYAAYETPPGTPAPRVVAMIVSRSAS